MSLIDGSHSGAPTPGPYDYGDPGEVASRKTVDPRVWQIGLLAALVAGLIGYFVWHVTRDTGESVTRIRHYPARFDGQTVMLRGRVGETFQMGTSWAYYLHQGRDTIVVFSRIHAPVKDSKVKVVGSISMGYLDGQPRPALFESETAP